MMEVVTTCPKCGCGYRWDLHRVEPTPDGGSRPAPSPNCPQCGCDATGSNTPRGKDLHWYARRDDVESLQKALRPGLGNLFGALCPDINVRNSGGATPLMIAAIRGNGRAAAFLIANGADKAATTQSGETALDLARKWKHPELVELLTSPSAMTSPAAPSPSQPVAGSGLTVKTSTVGGSGIFQISGSMAELAQKERDIDRQMGEMYFACPKCGYSVRINAMGKMMLQEDARIFRSHFGERTCKKCGTKFTACDQVKKGDCPDFDYANDKPL